MAELEKLYTVDDIAQMTALTTRTIRNYLRNGMLKGRKIGGQWRFTQADVQAMLERGAVITEMRAIHAGGCFVVKRKAERMKARKKGGKIQLREQSADRAVGGKRIHDVAS